ncbi:MAG: hypothetical protein V1749_05985 [Candidatus Desantisbacteria bacterium]
MTRIQSIILLTVLINITIGCTGIHSMVAANSQYGTKCITMDLWHDAKFHLEKAMKNNPDNMFVCNNLGVVYEYFGDNDNAKRLYEKAVGISIENAGTERHKGTKAQSKNSRQGMGGSTENICYQNLKAFMEETGQTQIMPVAGTFSASKKILSKRVEIKKKLIPVLTVDGINRVGIFVLLPDEKSMPLQDTKGNSITTPAPSHQWKMTPQSAFPDEKTEEIASMIVEAFKEKIQEESSFYIDEETLQAINEGAHLANEAIIDLCNDSDIQGVFVLEIIEFKDDRTKLLTSKSRYSEEERRYIYYDIPSITRKVALKIRFCFFEAKTGNLLWDKKYDISKVKEYSGEDEGKIPLCDMELFENLCNEPSNNFISATKPQHRCSKRQILIER